MTSSPPPAPRASPARSWLALLAALVGGTVAFFHRAALSEQVFISRDILRVYYPFKQFWVERVSRGEFPDWYPYDGLGQPFAGMVISGVFHPSNLLYLLLPLEVALKLNLLLCFPIAASGVFAFGRRLGLSLGPAALAGVAFAFSGYLVTITNNLLYLMAAATFPWALWATDRFLCRRTLLDAVAAAGLLTLILLSGDSQSFTVSCGLVLVLAAVRVPRQQLGHSAAAALGLLALAALFSAVQLVPALHVVGNTAMGSRPIDQALSWSMHPLRLIELALGPIFGGVPGSPSSSAISQHLLAPGNSSLWVESLHVGAPALVLAAVALWVYRRRPAAWVALGVAALILLLALGKYGGVYQLAYELLPMWRPFRYPEKLAPYLVFVLVLGAGAGLQALGEHPAARRTTAWLLGAVALVCGGLAAAEALGGTFSRGLVTALWSGPGPAPAVIERLSRAFLEGCLQTGVFAVLFLLAIFASRRVRSAVLPLLAGLHLFAANERMYEVALPELLRTPGGFVGAIAAREGALRLGGPRVYAALDYQWLPPAKDLDVTDRFAASVITGFQPVTPALWGLEGAHGYLPASSGRFDRLVRQPELYFKRFLGLFGAPYVTVTRGLYGSIGGNANAIVAEHAPFDLLLLKNPTARPRTYLSRPRCVGSADEALTLITSREVDWQREAVVECAGLPSPPGRAAEDAELGEAAIATYAPERVEVRVDAKAEALLVLNDAYYGGWTATLDGRPVPILPANYAVRGVLVPPGRHAVVFTYRTPFLAAGAAVSGSSFAVALALGLILRRRTPSVAG